MKTAEANFKDNDLNREMPLPPYKHYDLQRLSSTHNLALFAEVRSRVKAAVAALPSSITLSDAMKQMERFRAAYRRK